MEDMAVEMATTMDLEVMVCDFHICLLCYCNPHPHITCLLVLTNFVVYARFILKPVDKTCIT